MTTLALRGAIPVIDVASKTCPGAGEQDRHTLPTTMFSPDRSRPDGLAPYCRPCAAVKQREWKARNPEKVRAAKMKYRANGGGDV